MSGFNKVIEVVPGRWPSTVRVAASLRVRCNQGKPERRDGLPVKRSCPPLLMKPMYPWLERSE